MRDERQTKQAIKNYADTVRKICFVHLKRPQDVEDVFQEVFMKYVLHEAAFADAEHEKAWLIRVAINACRDTQRSFFRAKTASIDELFDEPPSTDDADHARHDTLDVVMRLPSNYRDVVYLHYFEGYTAAEIAGILQKRENTIYTWLSRSRKLLKTSLGGG